MSVNPPVDTSTPSIARVYDSFFEAGKDNFEVDRALRDQILRVAPEAPQIALELRGWLVRVVHYLAESVGIDQFLDVGSGLPTQENTHEVAQRANPEATVVYVDNDPAVAAYGRALLEENDRTAFVTADLTRPSEVLDHVAVRDRLDWTRPIALLQCATLHHVSDRLDPAALMARYVEALPAGSHVGVTHWWDPDDDGEGTALARGFEEIYQGSEMVSAARYRTWAEIERLLPGVDLLPPSEGAEPALAPLHEWWPAGPRLDGPPLAARLVLGGVGRKA